MQMDQITQQNAALVEEASATSQAMNQQAKDLQGVVSQFKLDSKRLETLTLQKQVSAVSPFNQEHELANGTTGRPPRSVKRATNKPTAKLTVVNSSSDADFEEF
jgi:hypothetical protein